MTTGLASLHPDLLRAVANKLPARDARTLGTAFKDARAPARESIRGRSALNQKIARAARHLAKRNRDIMAVVTRLLHSMDGGEKYKKVESGSVKGTLYYGGGEWNTPMPFIDLNIPVNVIKSRTIDRPSRMSVSFKINPARRLVTYYTSSFGGRYTKRPVAIKPVGYAALKAFEAAGYRHVSMHDFLLHE